MAREKKYDLVFIDMVMPGMDGVQTCQTLRSINPDSILVFMTGKIDEHTVSREIEFTNSGGESFYLYKPFAEGEILGVTKKALQ
jgi:CheY-like chemotaxis protein